MIETLLTSLLTYLLTAHILLTYCSHTAHTAARAAPREEAAASAVRARVGASECGAEPHTMQASFHVHAFGAQDPGGCVITHTGRSQEEELILALCVAQARLRRLHWT